MFVYTYQALQYIFYKMGKTFKIICLDTFILYKRLLKPTMAIWLAQSHISQHTLIICLNIYLPPCRDCDVYILKFQYVTQYQTHGKNTHKVLISKSTKVWLDKELSTFVLPTNMYWTPSMCQQCSRLCQNSIEQDIHPLREITVSGKSQGDRQWLDGYVRWHGKVRLHSSVCVSSHHDTWKKSYTDLYMKYMIFFWKYGLFKNKLLYILTNLCFSSTPHIFKFLTDFPRHDSSEAL